MKANELMIGDWVMLTDPINNGEKVQVKEIHGDGYITVDGAITKMFEPIPLTAEILENNFLTQRGEWTEPVLYFFSNDYIEISIKEYTDGIWEVIVDEVEMSGLPSWRMYVSDVHQLQHALRLCNIDKEIEL